MGQVIGYWFDKAGWLTNDSPIRPTNACHMLLANPELLEVRQEHALEPAPGAPVPAAVVALGGNQEMSLLFGKQKETMAVTISWCSVDFAWNQIWENHSQCCSPRRSWAEVPPPATGCDAYVL